MAIQIYTLGGLILEVDGQIAIAQACCCLGCPDDCTNYPAYTIAISGISSGCNSCDDALNGTHDLVRTGCTWGIDDSGIPAEIDLDLYCSGDEWYLEIYYNCGLDCYYAGTFTGDPIPAEGDAPAGTYSLSGSFTGNFTGGGEETKTLSCTCVISS